MNNLSFSEIPQVSQIECIEYFPLRVVFDSSIGDNRFVNFYGGNDNLLEFAVSRKTNAIMKFQVVTCKNYEIVKTNLALPQYEKSGCVHLANSQRNNCDSFLMSVYDDGIAIKISKITASRYYAMARIILGVSDENELVSLFVPNLSTDEISHAIFELQAE